MTKAFGCVGVVLAAMWWANAAHGQTPGAPIFASRCAGCHGADGRGGEHAPNIATAPEVQRLADGEISGIIQHGIAGAGMPAFPSLTAKEVSDLVAYLRVLQGRGGSSQKLPGDAVHGQALFFGKAQCGECHMVNGKGGFLGAELSYYGAEANADQLRAVITDPGANLPQQKKEYVVVTNAGQRTTGLLKTENNFSITLQTPDGAFHSFQKADVSQIDRGSRSLMPAAKLSSAEMDDVISYVLKAGNDNATRKGHPAKADDDDDN